MSEKRDVTALTFNVESGNPLTGSQASRWASITVDGIAIFSEMVYDTDANGVRTAEQAERNILLLFGERLRRLLEDE